MMQISFHLHLHNVLRILGQDVGIMINFDINVYISEFPYLRQVLMNQLRGWSSTGIMNSFWLRNTTVYYWPLSLGQPTKFHWLDGNAKHINNPPDFAVLPPQGI